MAGRKKKTGVVPETNTSANPADTEVKNITPEDDKPNYVPPADDKQPEQPPVETKVSAAPLTAHEIALAIRKDMKDTLQNAPKRNDATTMPAIVNLRGRTGDFHFMMPQFDAATVQKMWNKYKDRLSPEEFVNYLYSTMGLNPPKLYMFMNVVNIA